MPDVRAVTRPGAATCLKSGGRFRVPALCSLIADRANSLYCALATPISLVNMQQTRVHPPFLSTTCHPISPIHGLASSPRL